MPSFASRGWVQEQRNDADGGRRVLALRENMVERKVFVVEAIFGISTFPPEFENRIHTE